MRWMMTSTLMFVLVPILDACLSDPHYQDANVHDLSTCHSLLTVSWGLEYAIELSSTVYADNCIPKIAGNSWLLIKLLSSWIRMYAVVFSMQPYVSYPKGKWNQNNCKNITKQWQQQIEWFISSFQLSIKRSIRSGAKGSCDLSFLCNTLLYSRSLEIFSFIVHKGLRQHYPLHISLV